MKTPLFVGILLYVVSKKFWLVSNESEMIRTIDSSVSFANT